MIYAVLKRQMLEADQTTTTTTTTTTINTTTATICTCITCSTPDEHSGRRASTGTGCVWRSHRIPDPPPDVCTEQTGRNPGERVRENTAKNVSEIITATP